MRVQFYKWLFTAVCLTVAFTLPISAVTGQNKTNVIIHEIEGEPIEGEFAYQVQTHLSVLNNDNNPVNNLKLENFTIDEDSKNVQIEQLDFSSDTPINTILVLDTSGSMRGNGIEAVRNSSDSFISQLHKDDQIGLICFNDHIRNILDITTNHEQASETIRKIDAVMNSGTCLYDAAYNAIQKFANISSGRRAIILLTDGVDEVLSGGICSMHSFEDVIQLATNQQTRVPIYSIGLGPKVDQIKLQQLSSLTGGQFLFSPSTKELPGLLMKLSKQLHSEYILTYTSNTGSGSHSLDVSISTKEIQDQVTHKFVLPELPTMVKLVSVNSGTIIKGITNLAVAIQGSGETVDQVIFYINEEEIGSDFSFPFAMDWDFSQYEPGEHIIKIVAKNADGEDLSKNEVSVLVEKEEIDTKLPSTNSAIENDFPEGEKGQSIGITIGLIFIGFSIIILAFVLYLVFSKKRKSTNIRDDEIETRDVQFNPNIDESSPGFATLTILSSKDKNLIDTIHDITKMNFLIGREKDNDLIFEQDTSVSRKHVFLERNGNLFYLTEVVIRQLNGIIQKPKLGTLINDEPVVCERVLLKPGDIIQLGRTVRIRFDSKIKISSDSAADTTADEIDILDENLTIDILETDMNNSEIRQNKIRGIDDETMKSKKSPTNMDKMDLSKTKGYDDPTKL